MAFLHPDRARALRSSITTEEQGIKIRGQAEAPSHVPRIQEETRRGGARNTARLAERDEGVLLEGATKGRHDDARDTSRRQDFKRPKSVIVDQFSVQGPPTSDRPPTNSQVANDPVPPQELSKRPFKRTRQGAIAKARGRAVNYPPLKDRLAWYELGKERDASARKQHAVVYRHLRTADYPRDYPGGSKAWKQKVRRELDVLGLGDMQTATEMKPGGEAQKKVGRFVEDDGFDIDIYGDEETRRRYEPSIRKARMLMDGRSNV